jgi:hypothetical protein
VDEVVHLIEVVTESRLQEATVKAENEAKQLLLAAQAEVDNLSTGVADPMNIEVVSECRFREAMVKTENEAKHLLLAAQEEVDKEGWEKYRFEDCQQGRQFDGQGNLDEAYRLLNENRTKECAMQALHCATALVESGRWNSGGIAGSSVVTAVKIAERKCRDVLVWRCQLSAGLGALGRRDLFLMELQSAACSTPLDQKFISQALHSHKREVAKEFPDVFMSNCQRTAARRPGGTAWPSKEHRQSMMLK